MRINRFWRPDKWLPVLRAMGPMFDELSRDPDSGFLGSEFLLGGPRTVMVLQYWRDFEALEAYARARDKRHLPA
jgi:heme-degrading monooxygenase HmoA